MRGSFFTKNVKGCLYGNGKHHKANIRKIYHTLCRTFAKGQKLQMGKIKEIFSVIKEEIKSSIEEKATFAKIEKKVEETKIAENADYARRSTCSAGLRHGWSSRLSCTCCTLWQEVWLEYI